MLCLVLGVAPRLRCMCASQIYQCLFYLVVNTSKGEGRGERWGGGEVSKELSFFSRHLSLLQEEPGNMAAICC